MPRSNRYPAPSAPRDGLRLSARCALHSGASMSTDTSITALSTGLPKHHLDKRAGKLAAEIAAGGDPDELLSDNQLAELSGLSIQWFQIGRVRGYAPPFIRLSPRRIRTRRSDYVAWL